MEAAIYINVTFQEVTPDSAEHGDFSDQGFVDFNKAVTFRELVELMKEHPEASHTLNNRFSVDSNTWFSCYPYTSSYEKGIERTESIHFCGTNPERNEKYWRWAHKFANA